MISTSYDLDESAQRNSSNSMNDEESIFLSSSSDEDIPLVHYTGTSSGKKHANKYMETMINDGLGEQEGSEESQLSDEANASVQYDSDDEEIEYIPTTTYTEDFDDHIEDVSDDEDGLKPTKIYDEYDPENLDSFNDSAILKKVEYEPTKLDAPKASTSNTVSPEMVKTRKTRQTRSKAVEKSSSPQPEVRVKRKYNRRQVEQPSASGEPVKKPEPTQKRAYNNKNRLRNSERKALEKSNASSTVSKRLKKQKLDEVAEMLPQGSPVTSDSSQSDSDSSSSSSSSSSPSLVEKRKTSRSKALTSSPQTDEQLKTKKTLKDSDLFKSKQVTASQVFSKVSSANSAANNIISGRIINLSSGFKIPKRPSYEASEDKSSSTVPPEKKAKTDQDSLKQTSSKPENSKLTKTTKVNPAKVHQVESTNKLHKTNSIERHKIKKPIEDLKEVKKPSTVNAPSTKTKTPKIDLQDSDLFMEALGTSKPSSRKHKPSKSLPATKKPAAVTIATASEAEKSATTPVQSLSPIEKSPPAVAASHDLNFLNSNRDSSNTDLPTDPHPKAAEFSEELVAVTTLNGQSKSNLTEPGLKKITKKKVVWADSCMKLLEQVSYFYLDESERENKKAAFKGGDFDKIEKLNEKELKFKHHEESGIINGADGEGSLPWPTLIPIDLPDFIVQPEIKSVENEIQLKREQNILAVLMFKQFLPDSPSEPSDSDNINSNSEGFTSKIIPLDDVTLNQSSESENALVAETNQAYHNIEPVLTNNHQLNSNNDYNDSYNHHHNSKFPKNHNNKVDRFNQRHHNYNNQMNFNKQQQKRQFEQENFQKPSSTATPLSPQQRTAPKLFTPASPPPSPLPQSTKIIAATPLSPPVTAPRLYSKLDESPKPAAAPQQADSESSSLINLSNSLLSSDEMTEKIKLILSQINKTPEATPAETNPPENDSKPKSIDLNNQNKFENNYNKGNTYNKNYNSSYNNYNNNMPSGSNYNPDYKKASKWSTPASNYNNNPKMTQQNQDNTRNNSNFNNPNRNSFQNNYRRGIGNRGDINTHSNFNNRNNNFKDNFNNSKPFNRGGGGAGGNSHDNFRNKNFSNHSRFDQKRDYGRENGKHFRDSNFENDSFTKKKDAKGGGPASAGNGGQWI